MAIRYRIRWLFILTAIVAGVLGVLVFLQSVVDFVERDYYQQRFMEGSITREQARVNVGNVVDTWVAPEPRPE
jgi:hypothetical protein